MKFNTHSDLKDKHAFLSPSKHYWTNYDEDKLINVYNKHMDAQKGTKLHDFARQAIELGQKLPRSPKTLNMYINDAIGFNMRPEQILFYSENCFGTADAISFRQKFLRIHDLKNGSTLSSMRQLEIYAAIFCLEYGYKPSDIDMELRIYQLDQIRTENPSPEDIFNVMDKIVSSDKIVDRIKIGG